LTRAEIDKYYNDAVRAEVMKIINVEFNKNIFDMDRTYDTTLIRNPQSGKYTLSYFRPTRKDDVKVIPDLTLDALLSEMGKAGLNQTCVNEVRKQAGLLPAVQYAELKKQGNADALELIADALTNFYINPSQENYNTVVGISARLFLNRTNAPQANSSYNWVLKEVSDMLYNRTNDQITEGLGRNARTLANYPADKRYEVFNK